MTNGLEAGLLRSQRQCDDDLWKINRFLQMKNLQLMRILLATVLFPIFTLACQKTEEDRIQAWPENPYYWQYKGSPVLLIGGSDDDNLFQWEEQKLIQQLDLLASMGGNYIRNTMSSRDSGNYEPFLKLDNGLYDLDNWNPLYWDRVENLLRHTLERDIIVQIELWDQHDWYDVGWIDRSMNPLNNINYTAEESALPETINYYPLYGRADEHPFFQTHLPEKKLSIVRQFQERFIERVIEYSITYPNVLYCINNESAQDISWSLSWLDFLRETANEYGQRIYISDMFLTASSAIISDHGFDFCDISQSASGLHRPKDSNVREAHFETVAVEVDRIAGNPAPVNSVKQYGNDLVGWSRGTNEGVERIWRSIFGGQAGVRFHRPATGLGLNNLAQSNIKSLRMVTDFFDMKTVKPHQKLSHLFLKRESNDAYIMGNEGEVYAVFFTLTGKEVQLDLSSLDGLKEVKWLNTSTAEWLEPTALEGDSVFLKKPADGHWLALISVKR